MPVRLLQLAVVAALQGLRLLFLLFGAALVLFAVTGVRDHLYARDPRQERQNSLGLFLQARADDAGILGLLHRFQPVALAEVTGDQVDAAAGQVRRGALPDAPSGRRGESQPRTVVSPAGFVFPRSVFRARSAAFSPTPARIPRRAACRAGNRRAGPSIPLTSQRRKLARQAVDLAVEIDDDKGALVAAGEVITLGLKRLDEGRAVAGFLPAGGDIRHALFLGDRRCVPAAAARRGFPVSRGR